ncbi:MAG: radical SAM protein [Candidatus Methanoperedens sp.]|nr:radical SAM protein [Candidatus Methanoperedens sp.]MCZ7370292.1 radical SAM protein [Candidatus Methanoperedens sp.]
MNIPRIQIRANSKLFKPILKIRAILKICRPAEIVFDLTDVCHLRCIHCYRTFENQMRKTFLSIEVFKQIPESYYNYARQIDLSGGGESILHPNWDEILEFTADNGKRLVTFNTSLSRVKDYQLKRFVELGCGVAVSLEGARKETYESIRVGAKYETVFGNLRRIMDYQREIQNPRFHLIILWTLYKQNLEELNEFVTMASEIGIEDIFVYPLIPHHKELMEMCCNPQSLEVEKYLLQALETATRNQIDLNIEDIFIQTERLKSSVQLNKKLPLTRFNIVRNWHHQPDSAWCSLPFTQLKIDQSGNIHTCALSSRIYGNVFVTPVDKIWNNQEFSQLRSEVILDRPSRFCTECSSGAACCPRIKYLFRKR